MTLKISSIFGPVDQPPGINRFGDFDPGLSDFVSVIVKTLIVIAGIYAFFNILLAGYSFLSAGDDPKKIAGAWAKIWQSILGLTVAAGSFVLAAIFGQILFKDPNFLLQLRIFEPLP